MKPLRSLTAASLVAACLGLSTAAHAASASSLATTPASSSAGAAPRHAPLPSALLALGATAAAEGSPGDIAREDAELAKREQAAPGLEQFRAGGRYIYIGSGATLVLVILLLIILL